MNTTTVRIIAVALAVAALGIPAAEVTGLTRTDDRGDRAVVQRERTTWWEKRLAIEAELEQADDLPQWAGKWVMAMIRPLAFGGAEVLLTTLELAPDAGFAYRRQDLKLAEPFAEYVGDVSEAEDGLVRLEPAVPPEAHAQFPTEYYRVPWGDREYLIAKEQMEAFLADVNAGVEPAAKSRYLTRSEEGRPSVTGTPQLPEAHADRVVREGIVARISAVHDSKMRGEGRVRFVYTTVTLDAGEADGVEAGMRFLRQPLTGRYAHVKPKDDPHHEFAVVTEVEADRSVAKLRRFARFALPDPEVGWLFSTPPEFEVE